MASDPLHDPEFLTSLRRDMLRFADMQLRNREQAEDAVQEALAGALSGREKFASRASLRTWVLSILKNKIIDVLRGRVRENVTVNPENDENLEGYFNDREHWAEDTRPSEWETPQQAMENKQFWEVFEACLYRLPEASGRIFTMREVLGFDTDEICQTLGITTNNCFVQLHRARLALRACLGANWFGEAA
ncbi:MAG: sigma-70 family RNA polymerase sigma factor [Dechloromonas sp.]|nr:sigma-70 family RNA polymerase sigma factor [Dechloromonas sp.]